MAVATTHIINGLDTEKIVNTVDAMKSDSDLAKCKFRLSNKWIKGGYNRSTVGGFYAAKEEMEHDSKFELVADEHHVFAGTDKGPNPVEHLLNALAGCVTSSMIYHAALQGIEIKELESRLEGDLDLRGLFGLSDSVRKGYQNIRVNFKVKTENEADLEKLRKFTSFSPVLDVVSNGTRVDINMERK